MPSRRTRYPEKNIASATACPTATLAYALISPVMLTLYEVVVAGKTIYVEQVQ